MLPGQTTTQLSSGQLGSGSPLIVFERVAHEFVSNASGSKDTSIIKVSLCRHKIPICNKRFVSNHRSLELFSSHPCNHGEARETEKQLVSDTIPTDSYCRQEEREEREKRPHRNFITQFILRTSVSSRASVY